MEKRMSAPQRVLVTGAAGGMGRELALQFSRRGCVLSLSDIDGPGLVDTAELCRNENIDVLEIVGDLSKEGEPERIVSSVVERFGGIDVVVNNAACGVVEDFFDGTFMNWSRTMALNVVALALTCCAAGRIMKNQLSGRIINVTSPGSRMALPDYAAYSASKAAVDSITRSASAALAPYGVLVNSVAPGMMNTEMQRTTELALARVNRRPDFQEFLDERTRRIPLGRRAEVAEIASVIVWLGLDAPNYMTAERLNISGGLDKD